MMNLFTRKSVVWALVAMLSIHFTMSAQQEQDRQQPKFNVQVNLVSLDVEVLDPLGNPVQSLTMKDFVVKENGKLWD